MAELVTSIDQIIENIETLFRYGESASEAEREFHDRRIKNGKLFAVLQSGEEYRYAPSKFAGYVANDISHAKSLNKRDGRLTNVELSRLVGSPLQPGDEAYAEIDKNFLEYCRSKKIVPSKHQRERRYWIIRSRDMTTAGRSKTAYTSGDIDSAARILTKGIHSTVSTANGQTVERTVKVKETDENILQNVRDLLIASDGFCQVSGLPYELPPNVSDPDMKASVDRIDSSGDYVAENMQVTCWFINRWKGDDTQSNFNRLLKLVRSAV